MPITHEEPAMETPAAYPFNASRADHVAKQREAARAIATKWDDAAGNAAIAIASEVGRAGDALAIELEADPIPALAALAPKLRNSLRCEVCEHIDIAGRRNRGCRNLALFIDGAKVEGCGAHVGPWETAGRFGHAGETLRLYATVGFDGKGDAIHGKADGSFPKAKEVAERMLRRWVRIHRDAIQQAKARETRESAMGIIREAALAAGMTERTYGPCFDRSGMGEAVPNAYGRVKVTLDGITPEQANAVLRALAGCLADAALQTTLATDHNKG
jgi:hypothetical protein